ncbi:uncharacterized protein PAC_09231 [Phialocephala subalpina]|uniref:Uncharacterized protein n=1 Tax=Phialocephala subalpina TaxID=576137 RepID=A0A1L7X2S4_9HELO|nr:uncharacterized protein PAC_09231 [Phialocephala subalpina]
MPDVLDAMDLSLQDLGQNIARGLDTVTRAIHETTDAEIADQETVAAAILANKGAAINIETLPVEKRNQLLARLVREKCIEDGFISAWSFLVDAAPNMGLPSSLVKDVSIAANVYERLKSSTRDRTSVDVKMSVGSKAAYDSIYCIGPKSLGGTAWRANKEYMAFLRNPAWSDAGYSRGIPPCVAMGWIGIQMKVVPAQDAPELVRLQLMGTVDFDMDNDDNRSGFEGGFDSARLHTRAVGTKLQGAALIGMLNYDLQHYIRPTQNCWSAENNGPFNLGPADVSPKDWTSYLVADCAALVPFAYDKDYDRSKTGMVTGMVLLQCQDLLFDVGCSNRVATVPYVEAAGVAKYGIHAAYAIAAYEATAKYFFHSLILFGGDEIPPFGYAACMGAGPWGPFGTRYRVWERCVKYVRQLKQSNHPEAKALLELSSKDLMLDGFELHREVGEQWARAMKSNESDLVSRPFEKYLVPVSAAELFGTPGVDRPDLCQKCAPEFDRVMASEELEEVHATAGLPRSVTIGRFGRSASLGVGLRRAVLWACRDECCDVCACRVGYWADAAAYSVLSSSMHDEPLMGASMWMLQSYFVGCIAFWPISVPFLLSGFDLMAELSFEDGAMGERDIVDI